jgi:ABC-type multidrug transport system ATPase subunit
MVLLADQAKAGTTVITVTHHLDNVDQADKLLILGHGEVVWFGSRVEALSHFDVHRLADVYLAIEDKPVGYWGARWRERQEEDRKLAAAGTQNDAEPQTRTADSAGETVTLADLSIPGFRRQFRTFLTREIETTVRDTIGLSMALLLPLVLAAVVLFGFSTTRAVRILNNAV